MSNTINFNGESFLLINDARKYLDEKRTVYEIENLYFYYKGFATEVIQKATPTNNVERPYKYDYIFKERVYLDCIAIMSKKVTKGFWRSQKVKYKFGVGSLKFYCGAINGENSNNPLIKYYHPHCQSVRLKKSNVYAKLSELDYLSKYYSIPKSQSFKINHLDSSDKDVLKAQLLDYPISSNKKLNKTKHRDEVRIKAFIKDVIKIYPNANSNDFISHCFDCYSGNNRALEPIRKIILELEIKHGGAGRRSKIQVDYMKTAPKYIPNQ